jgi:hypothetical protein
MSTLTPPPTTSLEELKAALMASKAILTCMTAENFLALRAADSEEKINALHMKLHNQLTQQFLELL